jgi:hypothetical protein
VITGVFEGTGNFATTGGPLNLTSNGDDDVFVARVDQSGNPV